MFNSIRWEYQTTPPSCPSKSMGRRLSSYAPAPSLDRSSTGITYSLFLHGLEGGRK